MTTPMEDAYKIALVNITHEGNEARRKLDAARAVIKKLEAEITELKEENARLKHVLTGAPIP